MKLRDLVFSTRNTSKPGYYFKVGERFGSKCEVVFKTETVLEIGSQKSFIGILKMSDTTVMPANRLYRIVEK